jgi:hypothetical protein
VYQKQAYRLLPVRIVELFFNQHVPTLQNSELVVKVRLIVRYVIFLLLPTKTKKLL